MESVTDQISRSQVRTHIEDDEIYSLQEIIISDQYIYIYIYIYIYNECVCVSRSTQWMRTRLGSRKQGVWARGKREEKDITSTDADINYLWYILCDILSRSEHPMVFLHRVSQRISKDASVSDIQLRLSVKYKDKEHTLKIRILLGLSIGLIRVHFESPPSNLARGGSQSLHLKNLEHRNVSEVQTRLKNTFLKSKIGGTKQEHILST